MKPKRNQSPDATGLRRRAEASLSEARLQPASKPTELPPADPRRLLHELQVHQVELEIQNTELQESRDRMETLLEKYTDLYDFAPVGYLSVDKQGQILEANLTGAALLGVERSRLLHRPLTRFVPPASQPVVQAFLKHVFARSGHRVCEATLQNEQGDEFWASLNAVSTQPSRGSPRSCRMVVSNITAFKQAKEAGRRVESLTTANQELRAEIVRRQAVERALEASEQRQGRLLEDSRRLQAQLRQLSHQLLEAQEEERKRISRELHDQITQTLVGIHVLLENLTREAIIDPRKLRRKIARTQALVERSIGIVHQFARELRPAALDDLGLISALHSFLKDFLQRTGIRASFTTFAGVENLDMTRRTVIYRVVQAALANVAEHAQATRVKVTLRKTADAVRLEIADNGKSFDVTRLQKAKPNEHLGLLGMRERVEMVDGEFSVESAPSQGTVIRALFPFRGRPSGHGGGIGRPHRLHPRPEHPPTKEPGR